MARTKVVCAQEASPSLESLARELLEKDAAWSALEPIGSAGLRSRVARACVDGRSYVLKRYDYPLIYAARTLLRRSRARREFESLARLAPILKRPVRPVVWGERRTAGLAFRSLVGTEELEGAVDLKAIRVDVENGRRPREERDRLVAALPALARIVKRMHDAGFFAATLFEKNVLWVPSREGEDAFALIDLPFARLRARPLERNARAYDLACLDKGARGFLTRSERLRLYLAYRGRAHATPEDRDFLELVDRYRLRREHATPLSGFLQRAKKRAKRTAAGKLITGRDPELRHRKPKNEEK